MDRAQALEMFEIGHLAHSHKLELLVKCKPMTLTAVKDVLVNRYDAKSVQLEPQTWRRSYPQHVAGVVERT